jgi:hypothetical protein
MILTIKGELTVNRLLRYVAVLTLLLAVLSVPMFASAAPKDKFDPEADLLIKRIMGLAFEANQSLNSVPYGIGDSLLDVEADWGPSDDKSTVVSNYYDRYLRLHYDETTPEQTITAIEDYDPQLPIIKLQQLKATIGQPLSEREVEGSYEVIYSANDAYNVLFVFESSFTNKNPQLQTYFVMPK